MEPSVWNNPGRYSPPAHRICPNCNRAFLRMSAGSSRAFCGLCDGVGYFIADPTAEERECFPRIVDLRSVLPAPPGTFCATFFARYEVLLKDEWMASRETAIEAADRLVGRPYTIRFLDSMGNCVRTERIE